MPHCPEQIPNGLRENWDTSGNLDLLYKYCPFDSEHPKECERTLKMLRERTVWMATPSSFNDPFDSQPSILRNREVEQRDHATILKNRLRVINQALQNGDQLADRQLQPIAYRELVKLKRLLKSHLPGDHKYQVLNKYFSLPPDGRRGFPRFTGKT
jgi:hypothetical protein